MKDSFRMYPGVLRYEFVYVYVKADSFRDNVVQGIDEVSVCGL